MFKKMSMFILLICTTLTFTACGSKNVETTNVKSQSKIKVVVSFNAMREITTAIGKDKVDIVTMIPNGTEPHDFEPKAKDLEGLSTAKIFVYNGFGMESWVDKVLESVDNKNLISVDASKGSAPIGNTEKTENGQYDPHLWISLKGAENQAENVRDALVKADPSNKSYYEKNYNDFALKLDTLYNEYDKKFKTVSNKNFVTGHAAFAYLCRDFGLKQNSVEDVFAEGEPSAKKLKELTDYCKKNKIKTIFVEDMVSTKVSDALAKEVGAKVEKIHTIESKEDNKDYLTCMKENLDMIYNSLK
ncbi:metal ABC transporter substrate-binding protein [Clostridium estertheticum]|uniref:Metal ABC transporter substrate-binding protein n=1 Tax=Clostridium estertheticum TaxID=238834 RepID=A0AA47EHL5_9CLOT|nr:metal ABC transporter substrate-binding protein [Clostridium estertheticum]MBU3154351.1 metal ABC transporter substrate-binding protein [Clostridium estertheticum]MBU3197882.1 metal ABC transporter substrate-binding protein [Clostridium estertheticum]WAG60240.1 metal ABC transporter substrate-binding protein [Clostridium estertheticum]WAG65682.1 metal ABC transporter substrate-binding protein [Clostridium estertheticum]